MSSTVSLAELLWAAEELQKTMRPSAARNDALVVERLQALMRNSRSALRVAFEERVVVPLKTKTGTLPSAPATSVTAKELQSAGLTFSKIASADPTLTPKALVLSGIVRTFEHVQALGVVNWADFVDVVGHPSEVRKWVTKSGDKQAWEQGFLVQKPFTFEAWVACRNKMLPRDLAAVGFFLGAYLAAKNGYWRHVRHNASQWLACTPREDWIQWKQLTEEQYERIASTGPIPLPTAVVKQRPAVYATEREDQQQPRRDGLLVYIPDD